MNELLTNFGKLAGIGGIAFGGLLLLYRELVCKIAFPGLTKRQAFTVILLIVVFVWITAIFAIYRSTEPVRNSTTPTPQESTGDQQQPHISAPQGKGRLDARKDPAKTGIIVVTWDIPVFFSQGELYLVTTANDGKYWRKSEVTTPSGTYEFGLGADNDGQKCALVVSPVKGKKMKDEMAREEINTILSVDLPK